MRAITGYDVTSWVLIDSISGLLTITAPSVTSETQYKFYIDSTITSPGNTFQKLMLLTVTATPTSWSVANWQTWKGSSSSVWDVWASNYSLNSGSWIASASSSSKAETSEMSKALSTSISSTIQLKN